jgi:hypothetical protein
VRQRRSWAGQRKFRGGTATADSRSGRSEISEVLFLATAGPRRTYGRDHRPFTPVVDPATGMLLDETSRAALREPFGDMINRVMCAFRSAAEFELMKAVPPWASGRPDRLVECRALDRRRVVSLLRRQLRPPCRLGRQQRVGAADGGSGIRRSRRALERSNRSVPGSTVSAPLSTGGVVTLCAFIFVRRIGVAAGPGDEGGVVSNVDVYLARSVIASATHHFLRHPPDLQVLARVTSRPAIAGPREAS